MAMAKKKLTKPKIKPDRFLLWVTLPVSQRSRLKSTAGKLDIPMSEFARRAILEAMRRMDVDGVPWPTEK